MRRANLKGICLTAALLASVAWPSPPRAQNAPAADAIAGVVTGPAGPEAGVWVIAETTDLPTRFIKIVVTDDQGRYALPELPKASYKIWVRGYGLVDSPTTDAAPGGTLDLKAVAAPTPAAAAEYYPAQYWWSMMKVPDAREFPGTGPNGNGIPTTLRTQSHWLTSMKTLGCNSCHQLGNKATRTFQPALGTFKNSYDAWEHRLQVGPAAEVMVRTIAEFDTKRQLGNLADWTDRIAAGELPFAKPERPKGVERNVVLTIWDWAEPKNYIHDEVATDKRNPTVNAWGPLYGAPEDSTDFNPILDPVNHAKSSIRISPRDPDTPKGVFIASGNFTPGPSPYWGEEPYWSSQSSVHNQTFDQDGRLWMTARIRKPETPAFCRAGSDHPSAKLAPTERAPRSAAVLDPKTKEIRLIDLCFTTHHLIFAEDKDNTLWFSSGGRQSGAVGWLNTRKFLETGDAAASQGWTEIVLDTNGNGKRDESTAPGAPADPAKDRRITAGLYGIGYNPQDGTIWGSVMAFPGAVVRVNPGSNPPETTLSEIFEVPFQDPRTKFSGYGPRGMDIDREGVVWVPLASGHLASFDRRKCKGPLNGPNATGKHCPEGWEMFPLPGPQFQGVKEDGSAQSSYYTWVDQFDTFGLGKNVPIATGNETDALEALVDGKFVSLRVPYPMGFFAKGMDGRIDDPKAGWKGKGLWSTFSGRVPFHMEGGKGQTSKVVKFQLRPDPLAR